MSDVIRQKDHKSMLCKIYRAHFISQTIVLNIVQTKKRIIINN